MSRLSFQLSAGSSEKRQADEAVRETDLDIGTTERLPESDELTRVVDQLLPLVLPETTARLPQGTYRVQLNAACTFRDIERAVGYLAKMGFSELYAAPFLQARPGSVHGYDIVDHSVLNAEIGTRSDLESLSAALRACDMGLIADVVPNHMCASPVLNAWWQDVLENGPSSAYASFFDIDWMPLKPDLAHKVLLPVLGDQFGTVLERGELQVESHDGSFRLKYFEHRFPLSPRSYALLLTPGLEQLAASLGDSAVELQELYSILTSIRNLPERTETDPARLTERRREKEIIKRRLNELLASSAAIAMFVEQNLRDINGVPGRPDSFDALDKLLQEQAYRLSYWRVAADEINYRRFFDINELAAIRTESPEVFAETHGLILNLLQENLVTGLRIDHPDGLYDPRGYLYHLQEAYYRQRCQRAIEEYSRKHPLPSELTPDKLCERLLELWHAAASIPGSPVARPLYIVTEKILAGDEPLPHDWPVHGTVGYEFLNAANGLFVDPAGERPITNTFARFTGAAFDFHELIYQCKRLIVRMSMSSELSVLGHQLDRISERNRTTRDFTLNSLTRALEETVAAFPIYRTYVRSDYVLERDRHYIEQAVDFARRRNPAINASVFDFVQDVLLLNFHKNADAAERAAVEQLVGKFQQITGPIMAKAVEDTAFYRYSRLVSLNEVGGEPDRFGTSLEAFHQRNLSRLPWLSYSMNASSTHDTKRSEDVRARISVLSENPKIWRDHLQRWARAHRKWKQIVDGIEAPDSNAEYQLYQTLIGIWPDELPTDVERSELIDRMQQYMLKVVREAKQHTSWISPAEAYEAALQQFVERLLTPDRKRPFLQEMHELAGTVAVHGRWNSLSQLVLKLTSPGIPDFYQGTEEWNYRLVDPDNRRPVDFEAAECQVDRLLDAMSEALGETTRDRVCHDWLKVLPSRASTLRPDSANRITAWLESLLENVCDGQIKRFVTLLGLHVRRLIPELWTIGQYHPLQVTGSHSEAVIAFAREYGSWRAVIVVPRWTVRVCGWGGPAPVGELWRETAVQAPEHWQEDVPAPMFNVISQESVESQSSGWDGCAVWKVSDVLRRFPVAILITHATSASAANPEA